VVVRGRVVAFDEHVGTGTVEGDDGRSLPFHCVAIADGSRRIDVGTAVAYEVAPGHLGRYEARGIRPASAFGCA
jgi:cold shock CspA family protein